MWFINNIVSYCSSISSFFYSIYLEVIGWVYPFWYAATFFYSLHSAFASLAWQFQYFGQWVDTTASKLLEILSWSTIQSYITSWFYYLYDLSVIFYYFWSNVTNIVTSWWNNTSLLVQSWYKAADQLLQQGIDNLTGLWSNLQAAWDAFKGKIPSIDAVTSWWSDWWGNVLNQVIAWGALTALQIDSLIDSWFKSFAPFWEGWQEVRDQVIQFFTDPWGWLYDRFDDFIERFW